METITRSDSVVRFGSFELHLRTRELFKNGLKLRLRGQPVDVLVILVQHPGDLVTRETLKKQLWPDDTFVDFEHILNNCIGKLREALGDQADSPKFIETLPRLGYRFIASVVMPEEDIRTDLNRASPASGIALPVETRPVGFPLPKSARSSLLIATGASVLLVIVAFATWYLRKPLPPPHITHYTQLTNDGKIKTIGGTDGRRLFVNHGDLEQIALPEGRSGPFQIDALTFGHCGFGLPFIRDVSPDGSRLLVFCSFSINGPEREQVWVVGTLGHPARFLTNANDAAWSADGKSVVYSSPNGAIYAIPSDGGESRLLVPSKASDGTVVLVKDLSWSANGKLIRFTREQKIWEASAKGGDPHLLLPPDKWPSWSCCGRWTPDGDFFLFLYADELHSGFYNVQAGQLWALDERRSRLHPPNAAPVQLTSGPILYADTISAPDGKRIYSGTQTLRGELVRYDRSSKQFHPFLGGISAQDVAFSKDGEYVAYVTFPDGILWRANRDGTNLIQLTQPSPSRASMPSWSPDGSRILYTMLLRSGQLTTYVISSDGGSSKPLFSDPELSSLDTNWSPDGKKVVFASRHFASPYKIGDVSIRIFDLETQKVSVLPQSEGMSSPRWSPDNRYIAAFTLQNHDLKAFNLKSQTWKSLLKGPSREYPSWSVDGRFLYTWHAGATDGGIYRTPVDGGPSELVVDEIDFRETGWWGFWFGLDPTDAPLLLRDSGAYEIYSLDLSRD